MFFQHDHQNFLLDFFYKPSHFKMHSPRESLCHFFHYRDTHVGKHLFEQCLRDLLRDKIVILVTHQLQYLQHVDQIVILNHGRVEGVGTYDSLRETGLDFAQLLAAESKDDPDNDGSMQKARSNSKLNRRSSDASNTSLDEKETENAMQVEEKRAEGAIGISLYKKYFKAGGGYFFFYIMVLFCLMSQLLGSGGDYFVSFWYEKIFNFISTR